MHLLKSLALLTLTFFAPHVLAENSGSPLGVISIDRQLFSRSNNIAVPHLFGRTASANPKRKGSGPGNNKNCNIQPPQSCKTDDNCKSLCSQQDPFYSAQCNGGCCECVYDSNDACDGSCKAGLPDTQNGGFLPLPPGMVYTKSCQPPVPKGDIKDCKCCYSCNGGKCPGAPKCPC